MIEVAGLTKRYGDRVAVDDLTFTVQPGKVTGFLGPNGAGKSTTLRMILGLDAPTAGTALVDGKSYADHRAPMRAIGALLEARSMHGSRSARNHLLALAATTGIKAQRVDEVIEQVGLTDVAGKRAGQFSLGMGQRLGIAVALLGDPATIMLDEPVNGLDPEGIRWIRGLLRGLAVGIYKRYFDLIANGRKTTEIRVNDSSRKNIKEGSLIRFRCQGDQLLTRVTRVTRVTRYADFDAMFDRESVASVNPLATREEQLANIRQIYPPEREALGVVAIGIELLDPPRAPDAIPPAEAESQSTSRSTPSH
ncbi:ATP-binding cassette domain-containing protein [Streptomyces sp. SID13031]|uniref:ATP-binding cassette domain-containing protein n=1 Tax=Streptomyces sp. SID13031 TaxID=2706046 RepID=UPI0013CAA95A|nr:ATP-binding cassette domain-containing protein [Streptomyces sp. SID13031]NEA36738.1 ATP-binding cassette domain-containing protein [Streptomyces sp. SID13031]